MEQNTKQKEQVLQQLLTSVTCGILIEAIRKINPNYLINSAQLKEFIDKKLTTPDTEFKYIQFLDKWEDDLKKFFT